VTAGDDAQPSDRTKFGIRIHSNPRKQHDMNATILGINAAPKVRRVRVYPRLSLAVRQRLAEYCARKGITERDAIEESILEHLDGTSDGAKVLGRLERLALAIDAAQERADTRQREIHRAIEVLSEAFGRFVRLWMFVHAAAFNQPATKDAAESLYQQFAAKVSECLLRGHRFVHDLGKLADRIPGAAQ
jgi:hypothetical protein